MRKSFLAMFLGLAILAGCSEKSEKVPLKTPESLISEVNPDTSYTKSMEAFEAYIDGRAQRGDTHAISHENLQAMITDSIRGYVLDIDKASTFKTKRMTFSEATKVFYNGENEYVEIIAGDYVANPDFFRANIRTYNLAQGVEVDDVTDAKRMVPDFYPDTVEDFFSWSSYNGKKRVARAYFGMDYRFFVTVEATDQDSFLDLNRVKEWLEWNLLVRDL